MFAPDQGSAFNVISLASSVSHLLSFSPPLPSDYLVEELLILAFVILIIIHEEYAKEGLWA